MGIPLVEHDGKGTDDDNVYPVQIEPWHLRTVFVLVVFGRRVWLL